MQNRVGINQLKEKQREVYISDITELLQRAEKSKGLGRFGTCLGTILPFMGFDQEYGASASLYVDSRSGMPHGSEIQGLLQRFTQITFGNIITPNEIGLRKADLLESASEKLAHGVVPVEEQKAIKKLDYSVQLSNLQLQGLPAFKLLTKQVVENDIVLRTMDYSATQSRLGYWEIIMDNEIATLDPIEKKRLFKIENTFDGVEIPEDIPFYRKGELGKVEMNSKLPSLISAGLINTPERLLVNLNEAFPGIVREVTAITVGPMYHHHGPDNYHLFVAHKVGLKPLSELTAEFGDEICFLAVQTTTATFKGQTSSLEFYSTNSDIEKYLKTVIVFPDLFKTR